jgi:putative salt-induced outer membrane protein YdiY/RNase P/RNase MRP subunit p29
MTQLRMPEEGPEVIKSFWRLVFSFLLCLAAASLAGADQVVIKNGDRITGSIVKKEGNTLTIKTESMGSVTVPWDQVTSVATEGPLNVVLPDGRTVQSSLQMSGGKLSLKEAGQSLALADVGAMRDSGEQAAYERLLRPGWADLWAGTASLGFAGTSGNAQTKTLTVGLNAARVTSTDKTSIYFNAVKASALINQVSASTAQAVRGGWGYNRLVAPRFFINTFNDYEYDRFQDLDLRFVLGGGVGYMAWKGERGRADLVGGVAYNHEKFSPAAPAESFSRSSANAYWGEDFSYKLSEATSLVQSFRMFNNMSGTRQDRMNFDAGANTRLFKWLIWNLSFSDRYLSNPVAGRKNNDILYSTGIGVTFAR